MSKFNTIIQKGKTKTVNYAGGEAYKQSKELELVSILLTSFVSDTFYRSSNDTLDRLKALLSEVDPKFAAKAAIFARDKFGMRSITHALAGELTSHSTGLEWAKNFYDKVVVRPDDMMEIMGYYLSNKTDSKKPKFPNSLKKGFAKAFNKFDNYQIGKYKADSKEVKLVDVVNLVHPVPTSKNKEALSSLISGDLKNTKTWESMLSQAGQQASNEEELGQLKADAWKELISSRKIGLMAILKNLRNILTDCPELTTDVCNLLTNESSIQKSRILPFRFKTAYDEVEKINSKESRQVLSAISNALDLSVKNVPKFQGDNLVIVDVSGSMSGRPSDIASLFAAIIAKSNNCDVMTFATKAQYVSFNPNDSVMTIRNSFRFTGGGTNLRDAFIKSNKKYERIIILSDMQSFIGYDTPIKELNQYKSKFNANPYIYSWDLAGLGSLQLPESNIFCLSGFSDKVFQVMSLLETDKNSLINEINSIKL